jgi:hypothetical protein
MLTVSTKQSVGIACGCYLNEGVAPYYYPFLVKEER